MSNTVNTLAASTGSTGLQAQLAATANTNPQFITANKKQRDAFSYLLGELICVDFTRALQCVTNTIVLEGKLDSEEGERMKFHLKNIERMSVILDDIRDSFIEQPENPDFDGAIIESIIIGNKGGESC